MNRSRFVNTGYGSSDWQYGVPPDVEIIIGTAAVCVVELNVLLKPLADRVEVGVPVSVVPFLP